VVPIIDLRIKFNFAKADYNEFTVVIILNVGTRVVGIVVDGVSDVITLGSEQIKPAPSLGNNADTSHIIGFGTLDERMRILMDVEKLVTGADLGALRVTH
jgi:purine-binding chemotaxis protein CheW